jgi:hypothetical protein
MSSVKKIKEMIERLELTLKIIESRDDHFADEIASLWRKQSLLLELEDEDVMD